MTLLGILMVRISLLKLKKKLECYEFIILLCYGEIVELFYIVRPFRKTLKLSRILKSFFSSCVNINHCKSDVLLDQRLFSILKRVPPVLELYGVEFIC
jgi:hypothetical protein